MRGISLYACLTRLYCFTRFRGLSYCLDYLVLFHGFCRICDIISDRLIYGFINYRQKTRISFAEYYQILRDAGSYNSSIIYIKMHAIDRTWLGEIKKIVLL